MDGFQQVAYLVAQRHAHTRYFKTVGEAVMHKHTSWKWKYLGLALKTAKRCGKQQTVAVSLELRTVVMTFDMTMFLAKAFVGDELQPIHTAKVI